jgi:hypothetical protein
MLGLQQGQFCKFEGAVHQKTCNLPPFQHLPARMTSTSSFPLLDELKKDPIMLYLLNGGSWFEADQMHWRSVLADALDQMPHVGAKRRRELLELKCYAEQQLGIKSEDAAPKPAEKAPNKALGSFAALADDSDDE